MKSSINQTSVKISKKFDQQLHAILAGELKKAKITKDQVIRNFNIRKEGLIVT